MSPPCAIPRTVRMQLLANPVLSVCRYLSEEFAELRTVSHSNDHLKSAAQK